MEAKIIIFWVIALCAAALIEPVQYQTMKQRFEDMEISKDQTQLIEQMEQLNKRIDTLTERVMADSCKNELLIKL